MFKRQVTRVRASARKSARVSGALLLTASTAWIGAYFWIHTTFGQSQFRASVLERFDHVRMDALVPGASPLAWWARGLVIAPSPKRAALEADVAYVELAPQALWSEQLHIRRAGASGFALRFDWDASGRSNWRSLRRAKDAESAHQRGRDWSIEEVDLGGGSLSFTWPTWGMDFADVVCQGALARTLQDGLSIHASLRGKRADIHSDKGIQSFDTHAIDGFIWREGGFEVDELALRSSSDSAMSASGSMAFRGGLSAELEGRVKLAAADAPRSQWSKWLPEGASLAHWALSREPAQDWHLRVRDAELPSLSWRSFRALKLESSFELAWGGGRAIPSFSLQKLSLAADELVHSPHFLARGVDLGALDISFGAASEARVQGLALASVEHAGERVDAIEFEGALVANIAGGSIRAELTSDSGELSLSGPVQTKLFGPRADVQMTWRFERVRRGLASWLRSWFPESERSRAPEPMQGEAKARVGLGLGSPPTWAWSDFEWEGTSP